MDSLTTANQKYESLLVEHGRVTEELRQTRRQLDEAIQELLTSEREVRLESSFRVEECALSWFC